VSARKIGFLILILAFGAVVEVAWNVRESHYSFGPEGLRVLGGRFYGPSFEFEESAERSLDADATISLEVRNSFGEVRVLPGDAPVARIRLRKVIFRPTEEKARAFAERVELQIEEEEGLLRVGTNRDDAERGDEVGFETHLELSVPAGTAAWVHNDHGAVDVRGVASAQVRSAFDDVRVENVAGEVTVEARQGGVTVADIGGDLVLESRHGDVEVSAIAGQADLDVQHGRLTVRETEGLKARVSYGEATAETIVGDVSIHARHAGVRTSDVGGQVDVETSFADIRIEGAGGPIQARVTHGDIVLAPGIAITRAIDASASDGEIRLSVPEGSRFELDAESLHGRVNADVPGLHAVATGDGEPARASGPVGGGGPRVALRARGEIVVEAGPGDLPAEQE